MTLYQAESRCCPPRTSIGLRWTPSNCAGRAAIAPRERSLRASVFSSTRRQPSRSNACSSMSSFASTLMPVAQTSGVEPRPADLEAAVLGAECEVAGAADDAVVLAAQGDERHSVPSAWLASAASR